VHVQAPTAAVRYWIADLWRNDSTNSDVRERVFTALKRADIPLAVPAATIFLSNDDTALRTTPTCRTGS